MDNDIATLHVIGSFPVYKWKCNLFGIQHMQWQVEKPPNWFWRWMQYLCFGNKWERLP